MRTALLLLLLSVPHESTEFEVASVKHNSTTPLGRMTFQPSAGGLTVGNMPLRLLIQRAYTVRAFQISGGPSWIDADRYDIAAKTGHPVPESDVTGPMLRTLLETRFALQLHRETRELPVLNLTESSTGPKLAKSDPADCADVESTFPCHEVVLAMSPTGTRLRGRQASSAQLVQTLASILGRPVIDKTTRSRNFDLDLEVSLDSLDGIAGLLPPGASARSADDTAPSIFSALPQQLGLKLTPGKGPVEVLVIDHVAQPTGN